MTQADRDTKFMELAYEEARRGYEEGGIPIVSPGRCGQQNLQC